MNIPKSQYRKAKYSQGDEFVDAKTKKPFNGWYFQRYDDQFFSGKKPSDTQKRLLPLAELRTKEVAFRNEDIEPTEVQRENGYFYRYFVQDKRNKKIIEVGIDKYNYFVSKTYLIGVKVKWTLKGPAENKITEGYKYIGAKEKNKEAVRVFKNNIKELPEHIKNYAQFVE